MKSEKEKLIVFGVLFIFGTVLVLTTASLDKVFSQTNSTLNQTSMPNNSSANSSAATPSAQKEASQSIRGAITETGEFLGNVTQKIVTSKSAGAILNETSDVLGDAYIEAKKFFSPN